MNSFAAASPPVGCCGSRSGRFGGASVVARATESVATCDSNRCERTAASASEQGARPAGPATGRRTEKTVKQDPTLEKDLEKLIEPVIRGDPENPFAMDVLERASADGRTETAGTCDESSDGGGTAPRDGI
jgi:hypothetical protein